MLKKAVALVGAVVVALSLTITSFAASPRDSIYDKNTRQTEDSLVNVTRPEDDVEYTFKKSYVVCGNTNLQNITVELLVLDPTQGEYVHLRNADNSSILKWDIGVSGIFMKEVDLPYKGPNKLRLVAYSRDNPDNMQITDFSIVVGEKGIKDKIKDGIYEIAEFFKLSSPLF